MRHIATLALATVAGAAASAVKPPDGGTIAIEAPSLGGETDVSLRSFVDAAAATLTARGFTVLDDPGHAASAVELLVSRADVGTGLARAPGERAASVAGAGVSIPLSTGASQLVHLQRTRLEMRFRRRASAGVAWDGVAVTVREKSIRKVAESTVAADLVGSLLRSYPAPPRDVVGVP